LRIGLHTSISGGLDAAALEAVRAGANTFQIFSSSPRMWRAGVPSPVAAGRLRALRDEYDLRPLVIHDNYLINLASCDEALRRRSTEAFRGELERALVIGAEYLVAHPGNCKGYSPEEGIVAVVRSLVEAAEGLNTAGLTVLLENTAGAGATLGSRFEELRAIREYAAEFTGLRIGFCIDTCHRLVSGHDVSTEAGVKTTVATLDRVLGLANIPVFHANDSKAPLGSHIDRHQHIGQGHIGDRGFRAMLTHPKLRSKAFILETPHDTPELAVMNVDALKRLAAPAAKQPSRRRVQSEERPRPERTKSR
jgi:deoxyribonuclease-4